MSIVNRCVITVKAKKPFFAWLECLPNPPKVTLAEVNEDATAYLVPSYRFDDEREGILKYCFDAIFREQLMAWWQNEAQWPPDRDLRLFNEWFDIELHSTVFDLLDEPWLRRQ
jgi:hypothetical protein